MKLFEEPKAFIINSGTACAKSRNHKQTKMVQINKGDINATIETIQPTGADWIVGLSIFDKSIFLISSDPPTGKENDTIGIIFRPEGCHSFDNNDLRIQKN